LELVLEIGGIKMNIIKTAKSFRGDTIIEVLLAMTVAAFALGVSYSIANKSLQKSISARERNEAVNILQSQVAALKQREQQTDTNTFNNSFSVNTTLVSTFKHFCLDESATDTSSANWLIANTSNVGQITASSPLVTSGSPSYNTNFCVRHNTSTDYYIDIVAMVTTSSQNSSPPTIYQFNVRWAAVGSGAVNQASIYYRF
jgi:Tfp pilus assembly protein PilV